MSVEINKGSWTIRLRVPNGGWFKKGQRGLTEENAGLIELAVIEMFKRAKQISPRLTGEALKKDALLYLWEKAKDTDAAGPALDEQLEVWWKDRSTRRIGLSDDTLDAWVKHTIETSKSQGTMDIREGGRRDIARHSTLLDLRIQELLPAHVTQLARAMERKGLSASTILIAFELIRRACNLAWDNGVINRDAAARIAAAKTVERPKVLRRDHEDDAELPGHLDVLSPEERDRLFAYLRDAWANGTTSGHLYVPVQLMWMMLLRRGELMGLRWHHIRIDKVRVRIETQRVLTKRNGIMEVLPKGGKAETVATTLPAIELAQVHHDLEKVRLTRLVERGGLKEITDHVITNRSGTPYNPGTITNQINDIAHKIIGRNVGPHTFRRTGITDLLDAGVDAIKVQQMARHSTLAQTMGYYRQRDNVFAETTRQVSQLMATELASAVPDHMKMGKLRLVSTPSPGADQAGEEV